MRQLKISKSITSRESLSMEKYLQEISKVDLLTPEQEVALTQQIKKGDQVALEKLVKANLRFVVSVAKQYQHQGLSLNDLINEGNIGLIKAAQRFDETRGFKLISYAAWWIRQSILQALSETTHIVRTPLNKIGEGNKIIKASLEFLQDHSREPSHEELAAVLEMDPQDIDKILLHRDKHISLDKPLKDTEDFTLIDTIPDPTIGDYDKQMEEDASSYFLQEVFQYLTPEEEVIFSMFYSINHDISYSSTDIASSLGKSIKFVDNTKKRVLKKLAKNATTIQRLYNGEISNIFMQSKKKPKKRHANKLRRNNTSLIGLGHPGDQLDQLINQPDQPIDQLVPDTYSPEIYHHGDQSDQPIPNIDAPKKNILFQHIEGENILFVIDRHIQALCRMMHQWYMGTITTEADIDFNVPLRIPYMQNEQEIYNHLCMYLEETQDIDTLMPSLARMYVKKRPGILDYFSLGEKAMLSGYMDGVTKKLLIEIYNSLSVQECIDKLWLLIVTEFAH